MAMCGGVPSLVLLLLLPTSAPSPSALWQRNLDLVRSVSPTQKVEAGTAVQLECLVAPSLPPRAGLAWARLGRAGRQTVLSYWSQQGGVEDYSPGAEGGLEGATWTLTLHRVNSSAVGFYQCQVLLEEEAVSTRKVLLAVLDPTKVEHNTKYVIEKQGGNVTLDCTDFTGEQDANWQKLGDCGRARVGRDTGAVASDGKKLRLIKVDREDSGVYVCSVTGGRAALNVSLRVDHAPKLNTSEDAFQAPGYPAALHCRVAAVPVPAVSWLRGSEKITSNGEFSITISDYRDGWLTCSLELPSVSAAQYGNYTCQAANLHGTATGMTALHYSAEPVLGSGAALRPALRPCILLLLLTLSAVQSC